MSMQIERSYFCDSAYQVFTCLHMELHKKSNSDLYVLDCFQDSYKLVESLKNYNLFRKVKLIIADELYKKKSAYRTQLGESFGSLFSYINIKKIVEKIIEPNIVYKSMFFSGNQKCFRLVRFYYIKKKYNTDYYYFDEGVGSYDGHFEKIKRSDSIMRRMLFGKDSVSVEFDKYLYRPELFIDFESNKERIHEIVPFDKIDLDFKNDYLGIFNSFPYKGKKRCIYFDTMRNEAFGSEYALKKIAEWDRIIENIIGLNNLLIKSHPRSKEFYFKGCENYPVSCSPIEIDYLEMEVENMFLISYASTAVVTPKIVYDKEPFVLLLCNMDDNVYSLNSDDIIAFFNRVKSMYKDKKRFMMPRCKEELEECLYSIRDNLVNSGRS